MGTGKEPYIPWATGPSPEPKGEPADPSPEPKGEPADPLPKQEPRIEIDREFDSKEKEITPPGPRFPWWILLALGGTAFAVKKYRDYKKRKAEESEEAAQEELQTTIQNYK